MKGIILAGGSGTRLHPLTTAVSKQLLPVYDKPMIYYPLATLMMEGIRDILIITTPSDITRFYSLLGNGSHIGCNIQYASQNVPNGLAQAFIIGESFIGSGDVCLILGDNIFHGETFTPSIIEGGNIFAYYVSNPKRYGVIEFDSKGEAVSLEEKPMHPKSNYAVPGIYFYDNSVIDIAKDLKPSARGEYEITDVNKYYLCNKKLYVHKLARGTAWLDTGTFDSLLEASQYVQTLEHRQGLKVGCIEEIAWRQGYISSDQLLKLAENYSKSGYSEYLKSILIYD